MDWTTLNVMITGAEILGAFPSVLASLRDHAVSVLKQLAVALHLMPKTMKGKALFAQARLA